MDIKRRDFMKMAGLGTAVGVAGGGIVEAASRGKQSPGSSSPGKRWAMVIDVKKCLKDKGCEDCKIACHEEHNVPDLGNAKDEVKWIWKERFDHALHEATHEYLTDSVKNVPIPVLCNHCDNPSCTRVCPVGATWKRESDGIVMMDWHRCIGCRYCMAACPYGSRSFNWKDPRPHIEEIRTDFPTRTKGVVEKCTFCEKRLAQGKQPACVEACAKRAKALVFGDLEDPNSEVRQILASQFTIRRRPELGTQPQVYYVV
ncbi:MAG: 4Fe-4S dicluster domain-containing protein [Lentisphaerae bacterium]|nr:4Fe-4S dicluster domain-containing protein [Lentisphaerota bacterium]